MKWHRKRNATPRRLLDTLVMSVLLKTKINCWSAEAVRSYFEQFLIWGCSSVIRTIQLKWNKGERKPQNEHFFSRKCVHLLLAGSAPGWFVTFSHYLWKLHFIFRNKYLSWDVSHLYGRKLQFHQDQFLLVGRSLSVLSWIRDPF